MFCKMQTTLQNVNIHFVYEMSYCTNPDMKYYHCYKNSIFYQWLGRMSHQQTPIAERVCHDI